MTYTSNYEYMAIISPAKPCTRSSSAHWLIFPLPRLGMQLHSPACWKLSVYCICNYQASTWGEGGIRLSWYMWRRQRFDLQGYYQRSGKLRNWLFGVLGCLGIWLFGVIGVLGNRLFGVIGLLGNQLFGVLGSFGQFRALGKLRAVFLVVS